MVAIFRNFHFAAICCVVSSVNSSNCHAGRAACRQSLFDVELSISSGSLRFARGLMQIQETLPKATYVPISEGGPSEIAAAGMS